jgi:outer membrane protein assembly factor BamB
VVNEWHGGQNEVMARRRSRPRRRFAVAGMCVSTVLAASIGINAASPSQAVSPAPVAGTNLNWTVYHHDLRGSGLDTSGTSFSPATLAWTSPSLDGQLYGEPLVFAGRVFVATENDTVYALAATNGRVLWSRHLAAPVPAGDLPCGNITPTVGITGTPVIDPGRQELFVVADELVTGAPAHKLVGVNLTTGAVMLNQLVDPPGSTPAAQLERDGLTLDQGQVVFGFGGNNGDCSTYHGWVVAVPEGGGTLKTFEVDAGTGELRGAIWMGGAAPVVDHLGNVWVAAGNGSVTSSTGPYDNSDSVLELSSLLKLLQFFAPVDWFSQNLDDADLGSSSPALLNDGLVFQAGKSDTAYLMRQAALGGIGGQVAELGSICGGVVDGGEAFNGNVVYAPCRVGVEALQVGTSPPSVTKLWQTTSGSGGPAIIVGGFVWTISQAGVLYALNSSTGSVAQQFSIGAVVNHFPTPSVGDHLLLAPTATKVVAFKG